MAVEEHNITHCAFCALQCLLDLPPAEILSSNLIIYHIEIRNRGDRRRTANFRSSAESMRSRQVVLLSVPFWNELRANFRLVCHFLC